MKTRISLLLVVAALLAIATARESSASSGDWKTERYYAKETAHAFADIGKKDGGGPDDIYVTHQVLTNMIGKKVGVVDGYGVNLYPPVVYFQYTGVVATGSVNLEGAVNVKLRKQIYAISGGTGAYTGASGTVTTTDAGAKGALVVIHYHN
jgi:hypothetical protein